MQILEELLTQIYPEHTKELMEELSPELISSEHFDEKNSEWYKNAQIYVTYPDVFSKKSGLNSLAEKLTYIKKLGCNTIHILPFLKSPMIDAGFDISDFLKVRDELGGDAALNELLIKANINEINIIIDIIFNHISNQHEWFQKAVSGDKIYREYFIHTASKPDFIRKYSDDEAIWAEYRTNGKKIKLPIIFPEHAGEIPHWVLGKDNYWYFHTFYPHQIDLDWNNPEVFKQFAKILIYWSKKNVSFRLDAIPHVGKDVYIGNIDTTEKTHLIVKSLHQICKLTSPNSIFLIEAAQPIDVTIDYFGTSNNIESELAYNFGLNSSLWASIIGKNPQHIWDTIEETKSIPEWAQWVTFLRNHDQVMLDNLDEDVRLVLYEHLTPKGLSFKEGFGIAGRTANFLDNNEKIIIMSYALLASLPWSPAVYYGDEIGQTNNSKHMEKQTSLKKKLSVNQDISHDTRDLNRGPFQIDKMHLEKGKRIYKAISKVLNTRLRINNFSTIIPTKIDTTHQHIFAARYKLDGKNIDVFINLSGKNDKIALNKPGKEILSLNNSYIENQTINLNEYGVIWIKSND